VAVDWEVTELPKDFPTNRPTMISEFTWQEWASEGHVILVGFDDSGQVKATGYLSTAESLTDKIAIGSASEDRHEQAASPADGRGLDRRCAPPVVEPADAPD
jgi:hypothetical protein